MSSPPAVISISTLLEYALDPTAMNASGNVQSFERLFQPDALARLDFEHRGAYALLLFHPVADAGITAYVSESSALASDSGPRIMTFFTLGAPARAPSALRADEDTWLVVDRDVHPAYSILRTLFAPKPPPALPGLLFLGGLDVHEEVVYVPLAGVREAPDAREAVAAALSVADRSMGTEFRPEKFSDSLSLALLRAKLPYVRSERASTRELVLRALRAIARHRGDLVTMMNLGVGKP